MEELLELGLSQNESKVYQTLLEHGKLGSGEISKFSGVSYSRIYDILDSLGQKGIVKVIPEKTKKFVLSDPSELLDIVKKKEENLKKVRAKIKEMGKTYDSKDENPVMIGYGKNAFYKIVNEMKSSKKGSCSLKWTSEFRPEFVRKMEESIKEGRGNKVLTRYDRQTKEDVDKWLKITPNIRKITNEGVAMSIKDNGEVMIALIKSNVTMLIRDKAFAKIMKKMFLETYKNAERIK